MLRTGPHILVIHPDPQVLSRLYALLNGRDCRVATYTEARAALRYIGEQRPDLVLCPARFGDSDGLPLVRSIKKASPGTRVMVLAEDTEWSRFPAAMAAGADDFLPTSASDDEVHWSVERLSPEVVHEESAR